MSHSFSIPEQQALVAQWRASGLTMTQFAKQHGLLSLIHISEPTRPY